MKKPPVRPAPPAIDIAPSLVAWQKKFGRHNLPWRGRNPHRIWISEVMLQQTRVGAIGDRFARFVARFPDPRALAAASEDDILAQWSGLGYYARARNLRRAAQKIVAEHGGAFPRAREDILALPGVGASTAAAIGVFAFGRKEAILDGNVKRVLARVFGDRAVIDRADGVARLWRLAASCAARADDIRAYTQGVMDLGAMVCRAKNPLCEKCPLANLCRAKKDGAQASLPRKSAKKPRPQKTIGVAVVARADRSGFSILLQKRPARGIWGGLWSPLETAPAPNLTFVRARRLLRAQIKAAGIELRADRRARDLPAIAHEFTHFRLDLLPVLFFAVGGESEDLLWLPRAGIDSAPLSAPVARLLRGLDSHPALRRNQSESGKRVKKSGATRVAGPKIDSSK